MRRCLIVILGFATAAAFVGGAGGATAKIGLSTRAGVVQYLTAHGIDAHGIVIQRGNRNYVGATCPGARWNCTRASRVVQVATGANAVNRAVVATDDQVATSCPGGSITQLNLTGGNNLVKVSITSATPQSCQIVQQNTTGSNSVQLQEVLRQPSGTSQGASQDAQVSQYNASGANGLVLNQSVTQSVSESAASVSELQTSDQEFTVYQFNGSGTNSSQAAQSVSQTASDPSAATGSQEQDATLDGHVNQDSTGLSTSQNKQTESQTETALPGGSITQIQNGPSWCCSNQQSNGSDIFRIEQSAVQHAGQHAFQTEEVVGNCDTSGLCRASQSSTGNGTTTTNSCHGQDCHTGIVKNGAGTTTCSGESCPSAPTPLPAIAPPDPCTFFDNCHLNLRLSPGAPEVRALSLRRE